MNYNILILSNLNNIESKEDILLKDRFEKDSNKVDIMWIDYDEKLDSNYDLIIRRDTWIEDENDTIYYKQKNSELIKRLVTSLKTINLIGLDGRGKEYLKDLYYKNMTVIPTTDILEDALKWNSSDYELKVKDSFGSGICQKFVSKEELPKNFNDKFLIQPKLKFKSEVQVYFINNRLMYAYEYTPSKYPDYPEPKLINLTEKEILLAKEFADISDIKFGMKRIDFLRLLDDSLILLEIEDNSPHMNINILDEELRNEVLDFYVNGIYGYLQNIKMK